ncbi:MAG: DUF1573 domain-containing protein [Flavipsychrobacter sp.]|nr:DUF1573 domain-containing protein [Flavipsychrobacter sp.]
MKKCFFFIIMLSGCVPRLSAILLAQTSEVRAPEFHFEKSDTYDFGDVAEGPEAVHEFVFVNTGNMPLIINSASASCGCTVAEWTKDPVLPGKKGMVTVKYTTDGRVGPFKKDVFIKSNAKGLQSTFTVHIKGIVDAKDPEMPATGH